MCVGEAFVHQRFYGCGDPWDEDWYNNNNKWQAGAHSPAVLLRSQGSRVTGGNAYAVTRDFQPPHHSTLTFHSCASALTLPLLMKKHFSLFPPRLGYSWCFSYCCLTGQFPHPVLSASCLCLEGCSPWCLSPDNYPDSPEVRAERQQVSKWATETERTKINRTMRKIKLQLLRTYGKNTIRFTKLNSQRLDKSRPKAAFGGIVQPPFPFPHTVCIMWHDLIVWLHTIFPTGLVPHLV